MNRVRNVRVQHLVILGFVIGLVTASAITLVSAKRYTEPSVYLLGTGAGLSALIVSESSRILIASGDDPAALATAFSAARPAMLRRIDLVILAPGATERVAERAVEIANPRRLYALPNDRFHPGNAISGQTIRAMDGPSSIQLSDELAVRIEPDTLSGWSIEVTFSSVKVLLTERIPLRSSASAIAVMGAAVDVSVAAIDGAVIGAQTASPGSLISGRGTSVIRVGNAEVVRIRLDAGGLAIEP